MDRLGIQEALDYCLENPDNLSVQELLSKFPEYREELASLLALGLAIQTAPAPAVPAEHVAAMRARVISAARHTNGTNSTNGHKQAEPVKHLVPLAPTAQPTTEVRSARKARGISWLLRPAWVSAAVVVLLLVGVWSASASALPDSPFYNIKLSAENISLNFARTDDERVRRNLDLANSRLHDVLAMQEQNRVAQAGPALANYESHLLNTQNSWQNTSGGTHTDLARLVYISSLAGEQTMAGLDTSLTSLPQSLQADVADATRTVESLKAASAQVLTAAGIDPRTIVQANSPEVAQVAKESGLSPDSLLTPAEVVGATPTTAQSTRTPTSTAGASSAATAVAIAARATQTDVASAQNSAVAAANTPTSGSVAGPAASASPTTAPAYQPTLPASPTAQRVPSVPTRAHTPGSLPPNSAPTRKPVPATARPTDLPMRVPVTTVCDLDVQAVTAICSPQNCTNWMVRVHNGSGSSVTANWTAVLQIERAGANSFQDVATQSGASTFVPGNNDLQGSVCFSFPADTVEVQVVFKLDGSAYGCDPQGVSASATPCAAPVPQGTPGGGNGNGKEPPPHPSPPPHPTQKPLATRASRP